MTVVSDDADDVVLAHDQIILIIDFDFGAAVFRDQHLVALFHREIDFLPFLVDFPGAKSNHFPLLRFFLGGIGDDDPAFFHFLLFERLHQHPIAERSYVNCCHRFFVYSFGFVLWLSRRSSALATTNRRQICRYFFLSSSTTSNSASTTSPSRLTSPSSAPPRGCASGPGCGSGRGPACADALLYSSAVTS